MLISQRFLHSPRLCSDDTERSLSLFMLRLLLLACILYNLFGTSQSARAAANNHVIVLASAPGSNLTWMPNQALALRGKQLYVTRITVNNESWERLNLGFFDSYKQASSVLPRVRKFYPGAWISQASADETRRFIDSGSAPAIKTQSVARNQAAKKTTLSDEQLASLMTRAKSDFTLKQYPEAIRLFTAIVQAEPNKYSREALELLGLSRQRNGQNAHAFDIYTRYLEKYEDGEDSERVRQRLSALMTETRPPRESIRMSSEKPTTETIAYGSWSQFYRRDTTTADDIGTVTVNSRLINYLDLTAISKNATISHKGQFTADDSYDFLDNGEGNELRFIEIYYEMAYRDTASSAKFGRQLLRLGGILKRFDGISGGYQFTPDLRLNVLAGYPVETDNKSSINTDRKFYGFSFDTGAFLEHWNMNFFHYHQYVSDTDDGTSTGVEVRYSDNSSSLYGMVDYDYIYQVFNIVQFNANLRLADRRSVYLTAYSRKSPMLTTSNALIGRQETSIAELEQTLNIEQIRQLALDRTANSQSITVGGSQPVSEKFQLMSDITLSRVGSTVASGGVDATSGTGTDYFFSAQLVGNGIFLESDTTVLGLRYQDTDPSSTLSLIVNNRFPITRNWRINPRIQYDIRRLTDGRSQNKWRTLIRTDYRYLKSVRFDLEVGYDDTSEKTSIESLGSSNLYFMMGYRWDF